MKKVIIVHGWDGSASEGWFPWLKDELKEKKVEVKIPDMPEPDYPKIQPWVERVKLACGNVDEETVLIGHSIGCQAILRYLATLPEGNKVSKVIMVAPWTKLNDETLSDEDTAEVAGPWISKELDWDNIRNKALEFAAIFSSSDPYVSISEKEIFQRELDAEILVIDGPGHLGGEDGLEELPEILEFL